MYYGEKFNALTHLVGAVLALAGSVVLIVLATLGGDPWKVVSVSIYGATLVLLYSFSAAYHSLRGRAKNLLRKLDHHSIYLLIAGSYTPFCLVTLRGLWGCPSLLGAARRSEENDRLIPSSLSRARLNWDAQIVQIILLDVHGAFHAQRGVALAQPGACAGPTQVAQ